MDFKPIYPFTLNQGMKRLNAGIIPGQVQNVGVN